MVRFVIDRFFRLQYTYTNPIQRQRALSLLVIVLIATLLWSIWTGLLLLTTVNGATDISNPIIIAVLAVLPLIYTLVYLLVQTGLLRAATWLFTFAVLITVSNAALVRLDTPMVITLIMPLFVAGLFIGRRGVLVMLALTIAIVAIGALAQSQLTQPETVIPADDALLSMLIVTTILIMGAVMLLIFNSSEQIIVDQTLSDIEQFRKVARFTANVPHTDRNSILGALIDLVRDELRYDFAQIFLTDSDGQIYQSMRRGLGERRLVINDVTLVASNGMNEAIRTHKPVMLTRQDNELRRSHFLTFTTAALAVPIIIDDRPIAVLDVHVSVGTFSETRITIMHTLAEEVAALLKDINIITDLKAELKDQQITVANLRNRMQEMRQAERLIVSSAWDVYLEERGQEAMGYNTYSAMPNPVPAQDMPKKLHPALRSGQVEVQDSVGGEQIVAIPLEVRGEILGAMAFEIPGKVSEKQIDMAKKVASRLAQALENKRLFEQSQAQALRERKANEVANLLISATDIDSVVSMAAESFNTALGAIRTRVHLQPELPNDLFRTASSDDTTALTTQAHLPPNPQAIEENTDE